ncbi:MAG: sigma-70 family RNA polymerase sigma factor [Chloroflexota bacterium]|nr:sigma-70 family RNA polymerase sigma factor [Chloroflexota bacterium]
MLIIILPDIAIEDELLMRARFGDDAAVRDIYQLYYDSVYRYIRLRIDTPAEAEDLSSEVFVRLVSALRSAKAPRQSLRGWLFQVARNLIADHYGRAKRLATTTLEEWIADPDADSLEMDFIHTLNARQARQCLSQLTGDQQEVLILRFGQGMSLQETAIIMGKSTNTVKQLQLRALQALRRNLNALQKGVFAHG